MLCANFYLHAFIPCVDSKRPSDKPPKKATSPFRTSASKPWICQGEPSVSHLYKKSSGTPVSGILRWLSSEVVFRGGFRQILQQHKNLGKVVPPVWRLPPLLYSYSDFCASDCSLSPNVHAIWNKRTPLWFARGWSGVSIGIHQWDLLYTNILVMGWLISVYFYMSDRLFGRYMVCFKYCPATRTKEVHHVAAAVREIPSGRTRALTTVGKSAFENTVSVPLYTGLKIISRKQAIHSAKVQSTSCYCYSHRHALFG